MHETLVLTLTVASAHVPFVIVAKDPSLFVARCTRYPVMAEPFVAGAVQDTVIVVVLPFALGGAGVSGAPAGVTPVELAKLPTPASFIAATRKKYSVPLASPVALHVVLVEVDIVVAAQVPFGPRQGPVALVPTSTVYPMTGAPPVSAGAVHDSDTYPSFAAGVKPVGASGVVRGRPVAVPLRYVGGSAVPSPSCTSYAVPLVSPMILTLPAVLDEFAHGVDQVSPSSLEYRDHTVSPALAVTV
jgi:hypothetical protein